MAGLNITVELHAESAEAQYKKLSSVSRAEMRNMASNAEVSAAVQIKAIEAEMAATEAGSEAYKLLAAQRAIAMSNFEVAYERAIQRRIALEASANAAATKEAEKREKLRIRGQIQAEKGGLASTAVSEKEFQKGISAEAAAQEAAAAETEKAETKAAKAKAVADEAQVAAIAKKGSLTKQATNAVVGAGAAEAAGAEATKLGADAIANSAIQKAVYEAATEGATAAEIKEVAITAALATGADANTAAQIGEAAATEAATLAQQEQAASATNLNMLLGRLLIIVKDLARGQWARALSTMTTTMQQLGGAGGLVMAIVLGLAAGFYAAYKEAEALTKRLMGFQMPDFHPEYIAKHLQGVNAIAEAWKKVKEAAADAVEKYYSAAQAAERLAKTTKDSFEHEKKMAEYAKQRDLNKAKTPEEKEEIERRYAAAEVKRGRRERQAEFEQKNKEGANLKAESDRKMAEAAAMGVIPSKERDQQVLAKAKQEKDAAEKFLEEYSKKGQGFMGNAETHSDFTDRVVRGYNAVANTGVTGDDLTKATAEAVKDANDTVSHQKKIIENAADNEEKRRKRDKLEADAKEAAAKAAEIGASQADRQRAKDTADAYAKEESDAKLKADKSKLEEKKKEKEGTGPLTANQRIGAFIAPTTTSIVGKMDAIHGTLRNIEHNTQPANRHAREALDVPIYIGGMSTR